MGSSGYGSAVGNLESWGHPGVAGLGLAGSPVPPPHPGAARGTRAHCPVSGTSLGRDRPGSALSQWHRNLFCAQQTFSCLEAVCCICQQSCPLKKAWCPSPLFSALEIFHIFVVSVVQRSHHPTRGLWYRWLPDSTDPSWYPPSAVPLSWPLCLPHRAYLGRQKFDIGTVNSAEPQNLHNLISWASPTNLGTKAAD